MFILLNESSAFTLIIITTNKNKTATAPTYIITKITPKNSTLKKNKTAAALQKVKIKKITELIGLVAKATNKPHKHNKIHKKK